MDELRRRATETEVAELLDVVRGTDFQLTVRRLAFERDELRELRKRAREEIERLVRLAALVTVGQVIDAGDESIAAAGLSPYCINEGRAEGHERIDMWRARGLLEVLGEEE
jgi:hypothetical protein